MAPTTRKTNRSVASTATTRVAKGSATITTEISTTPATETANTPATAPTVAPKATSILFTPEEIKQRERAYKKNALKRRNRIYNEACEIIQNFQYAAESIWQAFLKAVEDFKMKRKKSQQPFIADLEIYRVCHAYYSLRFHYKTELNMLTYTKPYLGMGVYGMARDWFIMKKAIDPSLIEQRPSQATMMLYTDMRSHNDRSWRPCFIYFAALIIANNKEFIAHKKMKSLCSPLEGTASQEQIAEVRSQYESD